MRDILSILLICMENLFLNCSCNISVGVWFSMWSRNFLNACHLLSTLFCFNAKFFPFFLFVSHYYIQSSLPLVLRNISQQRHYIFWLWRTSYECPPCIRIKQSFELLFSKGHILANYLVASILLLWQAFSTCTKSYWLGL